jgi:hypothetical protein
MSRRWPPRVPPTFSDKVKRLSAVALEHAEPGAVFVTPIAHDDGCPALETWSLQDCTSEPVFKKPVQIESLEEYIEYVKRQDGEVA